MNELDLSSDLLKTKQTIYWFYVSSSRYTEHMTH